MPDSLSSRTIPSDLLTRRSRCLLLGAKGAGMTALADILIDAGHSVVGMDTSGALGEQGSEETGHSKFPMLPWSANRIFANQFDVCITSPAVPRTDSVPAAICNNGIPLISLHECLGIIFSSSQQLCVAGTHGKSTTSAMLTWILDQNGRRPGFFVGAEQPDLGCSGRFTDGETAVLESCEFLQSFRHLRPKIAVLTGIERDHFDCFPEQTLEDDAFRRFADLLPTDGTLVIRSDCLRSQKVAATSKSRVVTFCVHDVADERHIGMAANNSPEHRVVEMFPPRFTESLTGADFAASQISFSSTGTVFRCSHGGESVSVRLAVLGRHNVQNAVAAIAGAVCSGLSLHDSCGPLASFSGIRRRFENRGQYNGITLIDDYAHHPTAIQETLATARQAFPGRRILLAFEPHQLIRTEFLFPQFVDSLSSADEVMLLPVFPARETASHLECCRASGQIVRELNRRGVKAFLFANLDQIVSRVDHSGRPSDIFLTMGAGRTNLIHDQFNRRLQRNFVA